MTQGRQSRLDGFSVQARYGDERVRGAVPVVVTGEPQVDVYWAGAAESFERFGVAPDLEYR